MSGKTHWHSRCVVTPAVVDEETHASTLPLSRCRSTVSSDVCESRQIEFSVCRVFIEQRFTQAYHGTFSVLTVKANASFEFVHLPRTDCIYLVQVPSI